MWDCIACGCQKIAASLRSCPVCKAARWFMEHRLDELISTTKPDEHLVSDESENPLESSQNDKPSTTSTPSS